MISLVESSLISELGAHLPALDESNAILIKGLPVNDQTSRNDIFSEIVKVLGAPRCYLASRYGENPVHLLAEPSPPLVDQGLDWHTEDAFARVPPAFVALLCLEGDTSVRTHLCRLIGPDPEARVYGWTRPDPYLYAEGAAELLPLAFTTDRGTGWRYDPALIAAESADVPCPVLDGDSHQHCVLDQGDLLVFDNHTLAHARDAANPTGRRRVLRMILA
ncbi:MAG TPA: hypothetical protein VEY93_13655 [Longimicrobium sp.]|nr:hypothetical protein [Longimicrobium sp.]